MRTSTRAGIAELPVTAHQIPISSERTRAMLRTPPLTRTSSQRSPTASRAQNVNAPMPKSGELRTSATKSGCSLVQASIDSSRFPARTVASPSSTMRELRVLIRYGISCFPGCPLSRAWCWLNSRCYLLVSRMIPSQSAGAWRLCWTMGMARKS